MAADLVVFSLHEALEAAMQPQPPDGAVRGVLVRAVHLGQAAALLAFVRFQESRGRWKPRNPRRVTKLVRLDSFLRALDAGLLPILMANPDSPRALDLLARYAHHFKKSADKVGGSIANKIKLLADALAKHARSRGTVTAKQTEAIGGRIRNLRSSHVTVLPKPDDPDHAESGSASDDDEAVDFDLDATNLRDLLQAVADTTGPGRRIKPGDGRRVNVSGIKLRDAAPLRAVLSLQASRGWAVRGLGSLAALASVDACCQAVESGLLNVLTDHPTSEAALALFDDFADYIRVEAAMVHGALHQHATTLCNDFNAHANAVGQLTAAEMQERTTGLRRRIGMFRSRHFSFTDDDE